MIWNITTTPIGYIVFVHTCNAVRLLLIPLYIFVMVVLHRKRHIEPFNSTFFLIVNYLGISDVVHAVLTTYNDHWSVAAPTNHTVLNRALYKISQQGVSTTINISSQLLVLMAANRFYAIVWPFRHKNVTRRHAHQLVAILTAFAVCLDLTPLLVRDYLKNRHVKQILTMLHFMIVLIGSFIITTSVFVLSTLVARQLYHLSHPFRAPAAFLAAAVVESSANTANQDDQLHQHHVSYKKLSARTTIATVVLLSPYVAFATYTGAGFAHCNFDYGHFYVYINQPFPRCIRAAVDLWFCCQNPIVLLVTTRPLRRECRLWLLELFGRSKEYIITRFTPTASGEENVEQPQIVVDLQSNRSTLKTNVPIACKAEIRRRRTYDQISIRRRGVSRTLSPRKVTDGSRYAQNQTQSTLRNDVGDNLETPGSSTITFEAPVQRLPNLRLKSSIKPISHMPNVE